MLPVGPLTTQPHLRKLPYSIDSFDYICQVYSSPQVLAVRQDSKFQSVGDFIAYAKENPGKIKFGTTGPGTIPYLAMLNLAQKTDVDIVDVRSEEHTSELQSLMRISYAVFC